MLHHSLVTIWPKAKTHQCIALSLAVLLLTGCGSSPLATPPPTRVVAIPTLTLPQPTHTAGPSATVTVKLTKPSSPEATVKVTDLSPPTATLAPTITPRSEEPDPTPTLQEATPTATHTPRSRPLRMMSPEYGMQAFLWWRPKDAGTRDLGLIEDAGFGWVKQNFGWRDIEGAGRGIFDWSRTDLIVKFTEDAGLDMLTRLDFQPQWAGGGYPTNGPPDNYQDFGNFLAAVAARYKGRIRAYQIWNEPNLARDWGGRRPNPAEYAALLKVAYQSIKAVDPQAMVISAGLSPTTRWDDTAMPDAEFLRRMYQAGARPWFDVLGVHATGWKSPPEADPAAVARDPNLHNPGDTATVPEDLRRVYCFRHVEDLRQIMVQYGDADKQVAVLEFGWTTDPIHPDYSWFAVTEQQQADYLVGAYKYAREHWSPWIGLMCLIYISDPDWTEQNEQYWWAITWPGYPEPDLRPAYEAIKAMPK
mgnify:CR=1 FL=1